MEENYSIAVRSAGPRRSRVAIFNCVDSLVKDVIMPPIGLLLGKVDFSNLFVVLKQGTQAGPYFTVDAAQKAGAVTFNYGVFVNTVISFVIVAFAVFLPVRAINRATPRGRAEARRAGAHARGNPPSA